MIKLPSVDFCKCGGIIKDGKCLQCGATIMVWYDEEESDD